MADQHPRLVYLTSIVVVIKSLHGMTLKKPVKSMSREMKKKPNKNGLLKWRIKHQSRTEAETQRAVEARLNGGPVETRQRRARYLVLFRPVPILYYGLARTHCRYSKLFLPSSVLVTGFDIIFFWVARMV